MPLTMIEILKKHKDTCFIIENNDKNIELTDDEYVLLQDKIIKADEESQYGFSCSNTRFDWLEHKKITINDKERDNNGYHQYYNYCLPFLVNKYRQDYMKRKIIDTKYIDYIHCYLDIIEYHNLDKKECIYDLTITLLKSMKEKFTVSKVELLKFLLKQGVDIYKDKGDLTLSPYEYCLTIDDPLVTKLFNNYMC